MVEKKLEICYADFGPYGILGTSSQVTAHYKTTELIGKKILGCINLGIKNIAGFKSEFLLLGCYDNNNKIVIPELLLPVPNGSLLS